MNALKIHFWVQRVGSQLIAGWPKEYGAHIYSVVLSGAIYPPYFFFFNCFCYSAVIRQGLGDLGAAAAAFIEIMD